MSFIVCDVFHCVEMGGVFYCGLVRTMVLSVCMVFHIWCLVCCLLCHVWFVVSCVVRCFMCS